MDLLHHLAYWAVENIFGENATMRPAYLMLLLAAPWLRLAGQTTTWVVDSATAQTKNTKSVWAHLAAVRPLPTRRGDVHAALAVTCNVTYTTGAADQLLGFDVLSDAAVAQHLDSLGIYWRSVIMVRFDSYEEWFGVLVARDRGWHTLRPLSAVSAAGPRQAQSELFPRLLTARRVLVRYYLDTNEMMLAEFALDPAATRAALAPALAACGQ